MLCAMDVFASPSDQETFGLSGAHHASMAAASLTVGGTGAVTGNVIVLLTPEDLDQAVKKTGSYTQPGQ